MRLISKAALVLSAPIRLLVRHELARAPMPGDHDIAGALQFRATLSTAEYVEKNMAGVDSTHSHLDLLDLALKESDLAKAPLVLEFGVYAGTTINHIATQVKNTVYGFDSFEGLPQRWRDGYGQGHFALPELPKVARNVELVKGWFDKTLPDFLAANPGDVGFLHVDCDLYSSSKVVFDALSTRIKPGCIIVFDEYFNYPGWQQGEFLAFQEFIASSGLAYKYIGFNRKHEQVAVKIE